MQPVPPTDVSMALAAAAAQPESAVVIGSFVCIAIVAATGFGAFLLTRRPKRPPPFGRPPEHPDDQPPGGF